MIFSLGPRSNPMPRVCPKVWIAPGARNLHRQGAFDLKVTVSPLSWSALCACDEGRFPATQCPGCNESSESRVASFKAVEFPHIRLLACESCKGYLLVVDLSRDPAAIPEVDELAGLPLDLWAVDHGYHKLQPNLAGV